VAALIRGPACAATAARRMPAAGRDSRSGWYRHRHLGGAGRQGEAGAQGGPQRAQPRVQRRLVAAGVLVVAQAAAQQRSSAQRRQPPVQLLRHHVVLQVACGSALVYCESCNTMAVWMTTLVARQTKANAAECSQKRRIIHTGSKCCMCKENDTYQRRLMCSALSKQAAYPSRQGQRRRSTAERGSSAAGSGSAGSARSVSCCPAAPPARQHGPIGLTHANSDGAKVHKALLWSTDQLTASAGCDGSFTRAGPDRRNLHTRVCQIAPDRWSRSRRRRRAPAAAASHRKCPSPAPAAHNAASWPPLQRAQPRPVRENSSFTDAPSLCVPMRDRLQAAACRTHAQRRDSCLRRT